jgi:hypothetical protein
MWLNVKFESPSSEILPKLAFNIYTRLIFSGNLGMYDSLLSEQVADIPLQVQDGLGGLWCLTPLSPQIYRGGQLYWWRKPECQYKTTFVVANL